MLSERSTHPTSSIIVNHLLSSSYAYYSSSKSSIES
uniref:Uncharacterized protein n=1 Tax=Arundo donax TaxID=35708 RepID=A0A0A8ZTA1_ARUDO